MAPPSFTETWQLIIVLHPSMGCLEEHTCSGPSDRESRSFRLWRNHRTGMSKKRGQAPLRHTLANRPLLPSGPGGVRLLTVAQDLTSKPVLNRCMRADNPPFGALHRQASGADRVRTDDLLVANEALSQLSYSPFSSVPRKISQNASNIRYSSNTINQCHFILIRLTSRRIEMKWYYPLNLDSLPRTMPLQFVRLRKQRQKNKLKWHCYP